MWYSSDNLPFVLGALLIGLIVGLALGIQRGRLKELTRTKKGP